MMNNNYTNFWNDIQVNNGVVDDDFVKPKVDYIALAGYRRAIANFVNIVTNRSDIKVRYQQNGDSYTDGKTVTIGSKIDEKNFDHVVGLALHEGSHILLSDFNFLRQLRPNTPKELIMLGEDLGFTESQVIGHLKNMLNYVEDRRIDYYVFSSSPGYKGYYHAMYNKYFHSPAITRALKNNTFGDKPTFDNYMNRIINFTNEHSDLNALPELKNIYRTIFGQVKTMTDMTQAFDVAVDVLNKVYNNIDPLPADSDMEQVGEGGQGKGQGQGQSKSDMMNDAAQQLADGDYHGYQQTMDDIKNTDWDKVKAELSNQPISDNGSEFSDLTPQQEKTLNNALKRQKEFMNNEQKKVGKLTKKDARVVNAMEESGVTNKSVGSDVEQSAWRQASSNYSSTTQCLFVKNITQQMIDDDVFPSLLTNGGYYGGRTLPSIVAGKRLGTILGKKLQVRSESRTLKNSRLDSGRIDKRLIAELGFGNSKVFSTTFVEQYNDAILHISVDASGSMGGDKWTNTMTAVVAICKAASMISGLDVVVSFRTTHYAGGRDGQPLVAIGFDSRVDKFRKIENLWPSLHPGGTTPEGLCYEAIMKDFVGGTNNRDSYFLNFSDGQPMFSGEGFEYYGDQALHHTKKQVKEIIKKGISVMSYFVGDSEYDRTRNMDDFKTMYGNDAQFIDVTKVSSLAKTMNNLFLEK
jgi:nitric oxide reductase activation protein